MLSETAHGSGELLSAALQRVAELERHADEDARNIESLERWHVLGASGQPSAS